MPTSMDSEPSSLISRQALEHLVQLGFLCGQGLGRAKLAARFLKCLCDLAPADHAWLVQHGSVIAQHGSDVSPKRWPQPIGMGVIVEDGLLVAGVLPGIDFVLRLQEGHRGRSEEICFLGARLLGVALLAEDGPPGLLVDDYATARQTFTRLWVQALLARHGSVATAAKAAGINRATLYEMLSRNGLSGKNDSHHDHHR